VENQKALNTACVCVCVFIALVIQHAMRMHHNVIRDLSSSTIFFHYHTNSKISEKKVIEYKMCVLI